MLESIPLWILRDASIFGMDEPTERGNQNSSFDTLWMSDEDKKKILNFTLPLGGTKWMCFVNFRY